MFNRVNFFVRFSRPFEAFASVKTDAREAIRIRFSMLHFLLLNLKYMRPFGQVSLSNS